MGYLFVLMGKSATGKDSIYKELIGDELGLQRALIYTTRPKREMEKDGEEYRFVTQERLHALSEEGRVIESRCFHTVRGDWYYFTVDDGEIALSENSYLLINTLAGFVKTREYYGKDKVIPIYIEVPDKERLLRAIGREERQKTPDYDEMCRRFLADNKDFSEENLFKCGVTEDFRFTNDVLCDCVSEIKAWIKSCSEDKT